jgi:hypothetical protein
MDIKLRLIKHSKMEFIEGEGFAELLRVDNAVAGCGSDGWAAWTRRW